MVELSLRMLFVCFHEQAAERKVRDFQRGLRSSTGAGLTRCWWRQHPQSKEAVTGSKGKEDPGKKVGKLLFGPSFQEGVFLASVARGGLRRVPRSGCLAHRVCPLSVALRDAGFEGLALAQGQAAPAGVRTALALNFLQARCVQPSLCLLLRVPGRCGPGLRKGR